MLDEEKTKEQLIIELNELRQKMAELRENQAEAGRHKTEIIIRDISERIELQTQVQRTNTLLRIFNNKTSRKEYLDAVIEHLFTWGDCRCLGIRVLNKEGYIPYESYVGFSRDFWESENWLSLHQNKCICSRAISGVFEPQDSPYLTSYGSFCSNNLIEFIRNLTADERLGYRCGCANAGFKSVALIPIVYREMTLGAIHLADEQEGRLQIVEFIESVAPLIGEAIFRFNLEDELRKKNDELELAVNERTQELKHVNALLLKDINKCKELEAYLKDELSFRQVLIDTIPNPIFYIDKNGRYLGCNDGFEKNIGISKDLIKGKTLYDFHPKYLADKYHAMDCELFDNQGTQMYEYSALYSDGTKRDVIINKAVYKNSSGLIAGLVGVMTDITERKKLENELWIAKQKVTDILDSITAAFFSLDDHWNIIYANKTALRYFNKSAQECLGHDFRNLIPEIQGSPFHHYYQEVLTHKVAKHFEAKGVRLDKWFEVHVYPSLEGISVYYNDITSRRLMERSLQHLASIVENSSSAIYSANLEGLIMTWNPSAQRIYGYSRDEIMGKSASILYPPEMVDQYAEFLRKVNKGDYVTSYDTIHLRKDGSRVNVSVTKSPIKNDEGEVIGISSINEDISERIRLEEEMLRLDRLNLVGEMAASIAHEIRNPMTTVRGFLQLFRTKERFSEEKVHLDLMIEELDRANSIITEFLSLAKNRVVDLKLQNLNTIVATIFPLLQADALLHDMNITLSCGPIPEILLDEKEIRQLLLNLVRNGFEAMTPGGQMSIQIYQDKSELVLLVSDNGPGIPPEILRKLGTPFASTKETGAGLGLAACFSIASRHNARIEVESSSEGTTFYVRFEIKN